MQQNGFSQVKDYERKIVVVVVSSIGNAVTGVSR